MERRTQTSEIIQHMREFGSITQKEATEITGNRRLSSIIYRLRDNGYDIETVMHEGKNRFGSRMVYAEYVLNGEPEDTMGKLEKKCLDYMKEHGSITIDESTKECGIYRLAELIYLLRKKGYQIETTFINENTPESKAKYVLKGEPNND